MSSPPSPDAAGKVNESGRSCREAIAPPSVSAGLAANVDRMPLLHDDLIDPASPKNRAQRSSDRNAHTPTRPAPVIHRDSSMLSGVTTRRLPNSSALDATELFEAVTQLAREGTGEATPTADTTTPTPPPTDGKLGQETVDTFLCWHMEMHARHADAEARFSEAQAARQKAEAKLGELKTISEHQLELYRANARLRDRVEVLEDQNEDLRSSHLRLKQENRWLQEFIVGKPLS